MNGKSESIGSKMSETNDVTTAVKAAASLERYQYYLPQPKTQTDKMMDECFEFGYSCIRRELTSNLQLPRGHCPAAQSRRSRSRSGSRASWPFDLPEAGVGEYHRSRVEAFARYIELVFLKKKSNERCSDDDDDG